MANETMKAYILENGLAHLVKELVEALGGKADDYIEYVYDGHTMTPEEFKAKYFN